MIRSELCCFLVITITSAFSLALIILMQFVEQFVFDNSLCFFQGALENNFPPREKYLCQFKIVFSSNISIFFCERDWNMSFAGEHHHQWPHDVPTCDQVPTSPAVSPPPLTRSLSDSHNAAAMMSGILIISDDFPSVWHSSFIRLYRLKCHT